MSKRTYLLVLFLITFGFVKNAYTASFITNDFILVVSFMWGFWGWRYYRTEANNCLNTSENRSIVWLLMSIMLLSLFIPYLKYDQSVVDAFFSQRYNYSILALLLLYRIHISYGDFVFALRICAYLSLICFVLSVFFPHLFVEQSVLMNIVDSRKQNLSTDIGYSAPGFSLMVFYLYIKIAELLEQQSVKSLMECFVFVLYVILNQNRSTIIGTVPFFVFVLFFMKGEKKYFFWIIGAISVYPLFPYLLNIYDSLMSETQSQLGNVEYPRWQAIYVFLYEMKTNMIEYVIGSGVWSKTGAYSMTMTEMAMTRGAQISDIGWLGTFFYYGVMPIIILFKFVKKAIVGYCIPSFLKFYALWIIFVPTIHCFLVNYISSNMLFVVFFYFITYFFTYKEEYKNIYIEN